MYTVEVTITVREQEQYSSKQYARSQRETLSTGDDLVQCIGDVSAECLDDTIRQVAIRKSAESAAS